MNSGTFGGDVTRPSMNQARSERTLGSRDTLGSRAVQQAQFNPGDMIDSRYQVVSVIGRGGFGCVYRVNQVLLRKEYALKTLNPMNMTDVTALRLRKEAQTASRLEHPNLVQALDFGMIDGVQPFLVMDLVEGPTLAEYLKETGRLPVEKALEIFIPLAHAMAYAHRQGVVHRDLKPSNVILAPDRTRAAEFIPKIVDFGIAKIRFADESHALSLTGTGDIFGTPLYMSPEQCAGTGVDARSDIYSLGCMLFESLTGAPPFQGRNPLEVMMQHSSAPLPTLKEGSLGESFAPELERIVGAMLAKLPDERYSNSQKIADDLFWLQHGDFDRISTMAQTGAVVSRQQAAKQNALQTALIGVACTIIGVTIGFGLHMVITPPPQNVKESHGTEIEAKSAWSAVTDDAYVSSVSKDGESRVFQFPADKFGKVLATKMAEKAVSKSYETGWGSFHWWDAKGVHHAVIPTSGAPVSVPKGAKLTFSAGYDSVRWPYLYSRFRPSDLYGVILSKNTCSFDEVSLSQVVRSLALQDNLRILSINKVSLSAKAWQTVTRMDTVRCLDLSQVWVNSVLLTGKQLATFSSLARLQVLRFDECKDVAPLLAALGNCNSLRWLSIADDGCTDADVQLVGQLKNLEYLNLKGARIDGGKLLDVLATMKSMKEVVVDPEVLDAIAPEKMKAFTAVKLTPSRPTGKVKKTPLTYKLKDIKSVIDEHGDKTGVQELWPDEEWHDYFNDDGK